MQQRRAGIPRAGAAWLVLALSLAGCARTGGDGEDEGSAGSVATALVPVTLGDVERADFPQIVDLAGAVGVTADGSAVLRAPAAGVVRAIPAAPGTPVARGATVVALDTPDLRARVTDLEGAARVAAAQAGRSAALLADGIVSQRESDEAHAVAAAAQANAVAARALLQAARGASPLRGIVQRVEVHVGDRVAEGDVLAEIVDPVRIEFSAAAPGAQAAAIAPGAAVRLSAAGTVWRGRVVGVTPELDAQTQSRTVRVRFQPPVPAWVTPGLACRAAITTGVLRNSLVVPDSALVRAGRADVAFVVGADSVAHARPVFRLAAADGRTAVQAALRAGDRVVTTGASGLSDGMRVAPVTFPARR